jgi:hypothetical protein
LKISDPRELVKILKRADITKEHKRVIFTGTGISLSFFRRK